MGRGKPKVETALSEVGKAVEKANEIFESMSDTQRGLYLSLVKGEDEVHALLSAGIRGWLGIVKIVYDKEGKPRKRDWIQYDTVDLLDSVSYERLKNIAISAVKKYINGLDYKKYVYDISDLFKLVAPEALKVVADIAFNGKTEKTKLSAAKDLLDRAGYAENTSKKKEEMPVIVNINMNATAKPQELKTIKYVEGEIEEGILE